jgi:hypothetical protein
MDLELHELINDTLHLCKDPLFPKQILFTTDEDRAFFQKFPVTTPKYKEQEKPIFVSKLPLSPTPLPVRQTPLPLPVEKQPSPPAVDDRPQERVKAVEIRTSAQIKQTLLKIAPTLQLTEEVPDDAKAYYHLVDYLHYRLSGKQQGTYGSSKYTDDAPIIIKI